MKFKEEDIENLDKILSLLLLKNNISMDTLFAEGILNNDKIDGFGIDLLATPENEFDRYLAILKSRGLCSVTATKDGKYARKTDLTYAYRSNGGFGQELEYQKSDLTTNITNDFSGSTIGQVNQSSEKMDLKSPITQKTVHKTAKEPKKKSWIEILAWVIGIIAGLVAIYEFIIKNLIN